MTPFVLSYLHRESGGRTLAANRELIAANAGLAGGGRRRLCRSMTPSDDLPLTVERVELEPHDAPAQALHPAGRPSSTSTAAATRASARTSPTRRTQLASPSDELPDADGRAHASTSFSALVADAAGLPPLGARVGGARPRAASGGPSLAEAVGPRAAAGALRRLAAATSASCSRSTPTLRFKLDARDAWTDEVVGRARRDRRRRRRRPEGPVRGRLGRRDARRPSSTVASPRRFPEAWLEDARLNDETRPVLEPHRDRLTWDFPIHSVADVEALPFPPRCLNSKPSRFGTVQRLFDFYDYCAEQRDRASTAAASSSSGPAAARSSTSPRSSTPTRRTTSRRGSTTTGGPRPGLPQSPLAAGRRASRASANSSSRATLERASLDRRRARATAASALPRAPSASETFAIVGRVGRLDDVDEVVLAERRPLVQHLARRAPRRRGSPRAGGCRVRLQRLHALRRQRRQHQVGRHGPILSNSEASRWVRWVVRGKDRDGSVDGCQRMHVGRDSENARASARAARRVLSDSSALRSRSKLLTPRTVISLRRCSQSGS